MYSPLKQEGKRPFRVNRYGKLAVDRRFLAEMNGCSIISSSPMPATATIFIMNDHGGGERIRTDDLLRARQALSQLSYTPEKAPNIPGGPGWS